MSIRTYFRPNIHQNSPEILGVNGGTYDWFISCLACTYGVCALGPTPCKLAPHYLQGLTGMVMYQPCIEVALMYPIRIWGV
jgi:hypothetical protein